MHRLGRAQGPRSTHCTHNPDARPQDHNDRAGGEKAQPTQQVVNRNRSQGAGVGDGTDRSSPQTRWTPLSPCPAGKWQDQARLPTSDKVQALIGSNRGRIQAGLRFPGRAGTQSHPHTRVSPTHTRVSPPHTDFTRTWVLRVSPTHVGLTHTHGSHTHESVAGDRKARTRHQGTFGSSLEKAQGYN